MPPETSRRPPVSAGNDRTLAILAHVGGLLTSWVGPLVVQLVSQSSQPVDAFTIDHAREALNFQITMLIAYAVAWLLAFVLIGLPLYVGLFLANTVLCILGAVKAGNGETWRYPFAIRLIK